MTAPSGTRILELVEWLASQERAATLAETRDALDLPKSSTLVLLRTLVAAGYAGRGDDGRYRLVRLPGEASAQGDGRAGPRGGAWSTILRITEHFVRDAVVTTGESGFIAVMTPEQRIRYLCKHVPEREIRYDRNITIDRVAHHVSSGIAMLAASSDADIESYIAEQAKAGAFAATERRALMKAIATTRRRGVAVNLRGRIEGAAGVAAAILDRAGRPLAALNVSGPTERVEARLDQIAAATRESARLASHELARRLSLPSETGADSRAARQTSPPRPQDASR